MDLGMDYLLPFGYGFQVYKKANVKSPSFSSRCRPFPRIVIAATVSEKTLFICFLLNLEEKEQKKTLVNLQKPHVKLERLQLLSAKHVYHWVVCFIISVDHTHHILTARLLWNNGCSCTSIESGSPHRARAAEN